MADKKKKTVTKKATLRSLPISDDVRTVLDCVVQALETQHINVADVAYGALAYGLAEIVRRHADIAIGTGHIAFRMTERLVERLRIPFVILDGMRNIEAARAAAAVEDVEYLTWVKAAEKKVARKNRSTKKETKRQKQTRVGTEYLDLTTAELVKRHETSNARCPPNTRATEQ